MKRTTLAALLMTAVIAFALAGCSGNAAQTMTPDMVKGTWALDKQSDVGFDAYVSFEDENFVEAIVADSFLEGTWSVSGTEGKMTLDDERNVKFIYSDNKLIWGGADGSKLVFVKDDSEETKSYFALGDSLDVEGAEALEALEGEGIDTTEYVDEVINPIDPVTVADDAVTTITVTGKGTDFTGDPGYQLSITNKTGKAIYLVPEDDFKVGDKTIEAGLGDELEAGETLETFVYFDKEELGGALDALTTTDGVILVLDDETDAELARYTFHME